MMPPMDPLPLFESYVELERIVPAFLLRCGVAALCGGLIGIERELRNKPAGFRTNILICVGSSIYMSIGLLIPVDESVDPTRIAAQVVTGIGFLGAGCIIQSGKDVRGLTSAATIWVVASIGIVAGAGYPVLATIAANIVLMTLVLLRAVENKLFKAGVTDEYRGPDAERS
jgi:putative Mg2+ transporter-C (MgtC) family protein